ncbi:MAG: hypothetical protein HC925_01245, partial [Coleofasciculaceae cyanobacterium SM2_3_26]|nr:hypothetical protein [Coleofasciculaceae cyanobacterium SM2_3_26]
MWASKQPEWMLDPGDTDRVTMESASNAPTRIRLASRYGMKARLGVPILVSQSQETTPNPTMAAPEVLAVLVFMMATSRQQDDRLIELVSAVAAQLGTVMQQKQTEAELRAFLSAVSDAAWITDGAGRCLKLAPSTPAMTHPLPTLGAGMHEWLPVAIADNLLAGIQEGLEQQKTTRREYSLQVQGQR